MFGGSVQILFWTSSGNSSTSHISIVTYETHLDPVWSIAISSAQTEKTVLSHISDITCDTSPDPVWWQCTGLSVVDP